MNNPFHRPDSDRQGAIFATAWMQISSSVVGTGSVALLDQVIVSGASLVTTLLVGRMAGPEQLGVFALGMSLVLIVLAVQNALIMAPYTILTIRLPSHERPLYAGSVLAHAGLWALAIAGLLLVAALTGLGGDTWGWLPWVLMFTAPCQLLRDFARQFDFADLRPDRSVRLDLATAGLHIGVLLILAVTGALTAVSAHVALGLACGVSGMVWLLFSKAAFRFEGPQLGPTLQKNWEFGKWYFAGEMVAHLRSQLAVLWLLAFVLGQTATGVFAACLTVVFLSNPFVLGIARMLTPWLNRADAEGGRVALRRAAVQSTLLLTLPMAIFCGVVALVGGALVTRLYGDAYSGQQAVVAVLAAGVLAKAIGMTPRQGLWVLGRPARRFKADLVGVVVSFATAAMLIQKWGALGVAIGMLAGHVTTGGVQWVMFGLALQGPPPSLDATISRQTPSLVKP